jgi:ankyrin repeat protein
VRLPTHNRNSPPDEGARRIGLSLVAVLVLSFGTMILFMLWPVDEVRVAKRRLFSAARAGDLAGIRAALEKGVDVNLRDEAGMTPLMHAARGERPILGSPPPVDHPDAVRLLLDAGADPEARSKSGQNALILAARYGRAGTVALLLERGIDVNARGKDGKSALDWAMERNHKDVAARLRQADAR